MRYPTTYSRMLARELRLSAAGRAALLAGTRLSSADLAALDQRIDEADQVTIIENAIRLADRPALALELGSRLSLAAHGPLGQLLSSAPSLGDALAALERYHALRVPLVQLSRHAEGDVMAIRLTPERALDDVGRFVIEAMAVTVQRGIELLIGRRLKEATFALAYPAPAHAASYALHLRGPVRFGAAHTEIRIPSGLLHHQNPYGDGALFEQSLRHCDALEGSLREKTQAEGPLSARIARLFAQHPGERLTLRAVASRLGLSPRTVMRRLEAEGTSYQALLDAELSRKALDHLASPDHTVESAALALGYRDATAFRRAFKRWFGEPPRVYRERKLGGAPARP